MSIIKIAFDNESYDQKRLLSNAGIGAGIGGLAGIIGGKILEAKFPGDKKFLLPTMLAGSVIGAMSGYTLNRNKQLKEKLTTKKDIDPIAYKQLLSDNTFLESHGDLVRKLTSLV